MTWTFKDRFNPTRFITIGDDFPTLLKQLEGTFEAFRDYNSLNAETQKKRLLDEGITFSKMIAIHTKISYCLGTHDCQEDFYYEYYCTVVKKHFIEVHPLFAIKKYAEFIAFIKNQNGSFEMSSRLRENIEKVTDDI